MELSYQGLKIWLPIDGVIGIESFDMKASLNDHVFLELDLLVEEDSIQAAIHNLEDGDCIKVYGDGQEGILFAGKITDAVMYQKQSLYYLSLTAASYTMEWGLVPVSQSFLNLDATYSQVMDKVLADQPEAEIKDCVTNGAVIPDFLLQYEESDWDFLSRLASHFGTFLVPDCRAVHGRAYFGIPDLEEEYTLDCEDFREAKDMDTYFHVGSKVGILSQENLKWEVTTGHNFYLAQKIRFRGISTVVTGIHYQTVDGELVRTYELSRPKGILCPCKKNPHIFGMSIPATVKERSGNCVRVHFHIDREYDNSPNIKYFTYAVESSFIYCMPEVGSQVHIYFPGDEEKDAVAVHAIRAAGGGGASTGYAQDPEYKSFSNVNGAELLLAPNMASICANQAKEACVTLDTEGKASITGKNIDIYAEKNLTFGEPSEEEGEPARYVVMEAGTLIFQIGEDGSQIGLTEEAKIIATFVRMEASDTSPTTNPSLETLKNDVTAGDEDARNDINNAATKQLVDKYEEGRAQVLNGFLKVIGTIATAVVAVGLTVVTGGAAALVVATVVLGAASVAFTASEIGEGVSSMENALSGSLDRGHNFLRDDVFQNDQLYYIAKVVTEVAFGIVAGIATGSGIKALKLAAQAGKIALTAKQLKTLKNLKTLVQTGGNVLNGLISQYVNTGTIDPAGLAVNFAIGMIQGKIGSAARDSIAGFFGIVNCSPVPQRIIKSVLGTVIDFGLDWGVSGLMNQPFDWKTSLAQNAYANFLDVFSGDPVTVATGAYIINATDFILASLPAALKLERTYRSTGTADSVFGRGWSFPYASRIYLDTGDMQHAKVHMETITGHSLCFEKQEDVWVNQSKGTSRFALEVREEAGYPEQEAFLLTDAVEHSLCVYDRKGLLSYVEYPNRQRLVFSYGEEGLERIATPVGNVLEISCGGGHILQITDEIGRRTQYRYEEGCLTDVVHTDEGITHYEYDGNGHITSVTDQNGSRYLENVYDERGRVISQHMADGVCHTFTYDDAHRRNTSHNSENGRMDVFEYNSQLLVERIVYGDGTCETFTYSEDNLKTSETSRLGHRKEWGYDTFGRTILEKAPDGYENFYEYDENHDLARTWDTEGWEAVYAYDSAHNRISACEKIADGVWRETAWEYDSKGRRTLERDALGNETRWEYVPEGAHPARIITPKGEETVYEYDRMGRRMSISNSYGTVEMAYNSRNFVTKRTDGEGHTSYKFYDNMGNLTTYYPPLQWEKKEGGYEYRYDFLERVVDTISPMQEHKRVFRNFDGNITKEIHPVSYELKGDEGEGTSYEYDSDGNCIRIQYPDGGVERRFYDADGNMVKQIQPESYDAVADDGAGYCYAYDICGRLTMVQDPEGNILHTYEYNGHGQVIREADGEGKTTLYTYNDLGWKTREQIKVRETEAENGSVGENDQSLYRVIAYFYDSKGNKVEEAYGCQGVEKDGEPENWHKIHFSYDQNNHLTLVWDDFGAQVRYDYDCLGNVTLEERVIEENIRSIVHYAYNKNGWRIQKREEIQGNGSVQSAVTGYSYDANGNLIKIITPKGFEIRREYDEDDRLTEERIIDKRSGIDRREQYTYDKTGNVLKHAMLGADGERMETGFGYDLKDRLTYRTNSGGAIMRYVYDQNDRLFKEIGFYGYKPESDTSVGTTYAYDSRGNRIRVTNALGELVQELSYNLQDLPVMQEDTFGNRTALSYELDGQIKDVRRRNGKNTGDDAEQRILQQYEYNARGQIIGIVDGNLNQIFYDVDSWGRITGIGFVDSVKEDYEYTPAGQVSRTVDGNGNSVQYHYNSFGKVSERIDQLGYKETFQYDEEGNLSLHIDRDGRQLKRICNVFGKPVYEKATDAEGKNPSISTWLYDSLGRVTRAVCDGHSYEYIYDAQGNLKEKRSSGRRLVSYTYDKAGQVTKIKDPAGVCTLYEYDILGRKSRIYNDNGLEVRYGYDALNRLTKIHYGNGVETAYTYDEDGNISSLETKTASETLLSFTYQYDGNGNRTSKAGDQVRAAVQGGITAGSSALDISYQYDVRGQLLEERRNGASVCYTYDKAGNRIRKTDVQGETVYWYNEKNQLLNIESTGEGKRFTYDRQGSILREEGTSGVRNFCYDSRHRQIRVETETGDVQENRYDAEGLRFELLENGKRTDFVYHNDELLYEEGWEQNQINYHLGAGIEAFKREQKTFFCHQDEQLSMVFITDAVSSIKNSYKYDAFGNELDKVEQITNRIGYTGQQYDSLTKQYYLRARYYNHVFGRFMQEDIYQGDGLNLYMYCHNAPVKYYDPSGYKWEDMSNEQKMNIIHGNNFNVSNRPKYTYNEVRVQGNDKKPFFVVDSYEPPFMDGDKFINGQIVSRKYTQLSDVQLSTAIGYLNEATQKYKQGTEILDIAFNCNELKGHQLQGDLYLEVPKQNAPIPEAIIKKAEELHITIRENTEWHPKTSRNSENNLLGDKVECEEQNQSPSCYTKH